MLRSAWRRLQVLTPLERRRGSVVALATAALLASGCGSQTEPLSPPPGSVVSIPAGPVVVIPPGITSTQTADAVAAKMIALIKADERKLGHALGPIRILKVVLLPAGQMYSTTRLDGTNPGQSGVSPDGGPGWLVEALGTFTGVDPQTGRIVSVGRHGYHLWDDAGGEASVFYPCWSRNSAFDPRELEGDCAAAAPVP